ncbi:MAG: integrase core domain-containing protein, partial [Peptococcaceae bacterium]|nr:integrase core domain-containing protein [Peptococcaceae bacterium]
EHKLIRPRTPRHNGKVERSHRNDQERFYNYLKFYSYDDLLIQMQRYLVRSNNIPMKVLGWKSPREMRHSLSF